MEPRDRVDGALVRAWAQAAATAVGAARARIDAVNVFPVPDTDTGTNLSLTVTGGATAALAEPEGAGAGEVARAFAHGALLSARGNSGVILSQYLDGFARALPGTATAADVVRALDAAATAAHEAVADPQEGTVLTLAREVAGSAAGHVRAGRTLAGVLDGAVGDGQRALARISAGHPVLRRARVVDAGACGLLVLLGALGAVVAGDEGSLDLGWLPTSGVGAGQRAGRGLGHGTDLECELVADPGAARGGAFEVMVVVRGTGDLGGPLRAGLSEIGDSVAVVGADGLWQVHVHTDDPAAAMEAAGLGGRGRRDAAVVRSTMRPATGVQAPPVVACTGSAGLAAAHAQAGAVVVLRGDAPVDTAVLTRALDDATESAGGAAPALLLPGDEATGVLARGLAEMLARAPGAGAVRVLDATDELRVTVAVTLLLAGGGHGDDGAVDIGARCARALSRLRTAVVQEPSADAALRALDGLHGPDGPRATGDPGTAAVLDGRVLTVLVGPQVSAGERAELAGRLSGEQPGLEVLGAGVVEAGPAFWLGLD
ncbi:DAK2 domain-containing protein [Cellulomonas hominis]